MKFFSVIIKKVINLAQLFKVFHQMTKLEFIFYGGSILGFLFLIDAFLCYTEGNSFARGLLTKRVLKEIVLQKQVRHLKFSSRRLRLVCVPLFVS